MVWSSVILMLVACGGTGADLGISPGKRLADFDAEDACAFSEGFQDWQVELNQASCTLLGQGLGLAASVSGEQTFEAACVAARDECLSDMTPQPLVCADVQMNIPPTCQITVRDVETCLDDSLDLFDEVVKVGCDEPLDAAVFAELQTMGETGSAIPDSCADFYGPDCIGAEE